MTLEESSTYQMILEKGEKRGEQRGEQRGEHVLVLLEWRQAMSTAAAAACASRYTRAALAASSGRSR